MNTKTTTDDFAREAQQQIMTSIEALQSTVLQSARALGDIVDKMVPDTLRNLEVPGTGSLPSAGDGVAFGFDLAERILASQRKFVEELSGIPAMAGAATTPKAKASASSK